VPVLIEAMVRHGHLELAPAVRISLLAMSAATIDRSLRDVRRACGTIVTPQDTAFGGDPAQRAGAHV